MKASEYMKLIQKNIGDYGDLPVVVKTDYEMTSSLLEENEVVFSLESARHSEYYNESDRKDNTDFVFVVAVKEGY